MDERSRFFCNKDYYLLNSYWAPIREKTREYYRGEVSWRIPDEDKIDIPDQLIKGIPFRLMTSTEREIFLSSGKGNMETFIVGDRWATERPLSGDYAIRMKGKRNNIVGYLSFCLLANGDAFIMQVQGEKDQHFTPERRDELVKASIEFLREINTRNVYLITGEVINSQKKPELRNNRLNKYYESIAVNNGFRKQRSYSFPSISLHVGAI